MADFDSLQDDSEVAKQTPAPEPVSFDSLKDDSETKHSLPSFDTLEDDTDKYGTPSQQLLTAAEGASSGFLSSPVTALAEQGLSKLGVPGLSPEDQARRHEINPYTHGLFEAAGFGTGLLTGTGEAGLLARAGEAVEGLSAAGKAGQALKAAQGVGDLAKIAEAKAAVDAIPLAAKIGTAAAKGAAEMALLQTGDEGTKLINDVPTSTASALTNIGLSSALGGITGGAFSGIGGLAKKGLAAVPDGLATFTDRLKYRMTGATPQEAVHGELTNVLNTLDQMHDESWGTTGLKAEAISRIAPEMNPKIQDQMGKLGEDLTQKFADMDKEPDKYPARLVRELKNDFFNWKAQAIDSPNATSGQVFEATNKLKQRLQAYSQFEKRLNPLSPELSFVQNTRELGSTVREALEDGKTWGDAATVQKEFNKAFTDLNPFLKQVRSNFTTKVGDEVVVDQNKIAAYLKDNARAKLDTARQQRLGGFLDAFKDYQKAIGNATEKAGIENPIPAIGTGALEESMQKVSPWTKAADTWYDKSLTEAGARVLGGAAGGALGTIAQEKTGIPGLGLGGFILGGSAGASLIPSILQPMLEKAVNAHSFQKAVEFSQAAIRGEKSINNAVEKVFKAGTMPNMHYILPDDKKLDKLDKQVEELNSQPEAMINNSKGLDHYMPGHANEMTSAIGRSAQYLASIKPKPIQPSPLDRKIEPTKSQMSEYRDQLSIAEQPLQVLQKIKDGTLTPTDIKTLQNTSPALYAKLSKQLIGSMTDHVNDDGTVPYKTRMALSLFQGAPLDSTMSSAGILAAQAIYAPQQASNAQQQGAPQKKAKGSAPLSKASKNYQTPSQTAESDRSSRES